MSTYLNAWQSISIVILVFVLCVILLILEWKWLNEKRRRKDLEQAIADLKPE